MAKQRAIKGPTPDELAMFRAEVADATPLSVDRVHFEAELPAPIPRQHLADERTALQETLTAPIALEDRLEGGDEANYLRVGLSRQILKDLRSGRWVMQSEIDLHGLSRDQARLALGEFLAASLASGNRCVRVIHGKGIGSPGRFGVLRTLVRGWLSRRAEVLGYCQARPNDGGDGALYVLLQAPTKRARP
jgi:DNA-nicking Smr family endonuclease